MTARGLARSQARLITGNRFSGGIVSWTAINEGTAVAADYIAAIATAGGTISVPNQNRVTNLMIDLAEADLLKQLKVLYLYHGGTLASAAINAINPGGQLGSYPIIWTGTPTLETNGGFTPSNTAYGVPVLHIDSVFSYQTGLSAGFWGGSGATPGNDFPIGYDPGFYLSPNTGYVRMGGIYKPGTIQDPTQFHVGTREPYSTIIRAYRNTTRWVDTTEAWPVSDLYTIETEAGSVGIGRLREYSTAGYASTMTQNLTFIGRGLNATQVSDFYAAVAGYMVGI